MIAINEITFIAQVAKVQTLIDGGIRLTLDLGEGDTLQMAQLAKCQQFGTLLEVICKTGNKQNDRKTNSLEARTKRKSAWATEEETSAYSGA